MRRSILCLAVTLLVAGLAGCDSAEPTGTPLVPPTAPPTSPPSTSPPETAPPAAVGNAYIKGALVVKVGALEHYRSELILEAVNYVWSTEGEGEVTFGDPGYGSTRYVTARARTAGPITFFVVAYNAAGEAIARGEKTLTITP